MQFLVLLGTVPVVSSILESLSENESVQVVRKKESFPDCSTATLWLVVCQVQQLFTVNLAFCIVTAISICDLLAPCGLRSYKNRPTPSPGRMSYKATKPDLVLFYIYILIVLLLIRAPFYVLLVFVGMCSVFWLFWLSLRICQVFG